MQVSRSGYYAWQNGEASAREQANRKVSDEIKQVFEAKRGRYGSPRITQELRRAGRPCNHKRVERLMRQEGLRARRSQRRKVRTTQSDHHHPIAPNLLLNRPAPVKPNEVWVARRNCGIRGPRLEVLNQLIQVLRQRDARNRNSSHSL